MFSFLFSYQASQQRGQLYLTCNLLDKSKTQTWGVQIHHISVRTIKILFQNLALAGVTESRLHAFACYRASVDTGVKSDLTEVKSDLTDGTWQNGSFPGK